MKKTFNSPEEEITHLEKLLALEQSEDLADYQAQVLETPLKERQKRGTTWYPVRVKQTSIGSGGKYLLELERNVEFNQPHQFQVGGQASLFFNAPAGQKSPQMVGLVTQVDQTQMNLLVSENELPDWLDERLLGIDVLFDENSYREMKSALFRLKKAEPNSDLARIRDVAWGFRKPESESKLTVDIPDHILQNLNFSQREAVVSMMKARDVFVIHGPPGTGKTTTLVAAVQAALLDCPQVLVCAPSNTAADLLTEKMASAGLKVLRIGNPAKISDEILPYTFDYQISQHEDAKEIKRLRKLAFELKRMAYKFKKYFNQREREQKQAMIRESKNILAQIGSMEKYVLEQARDHSQVFVSTLVGASNSLIASKKFDVVMIDEAGQALEPACWVPISKAGKVVFAGDHCQLPPTVKSKKAAQEGLATTLMEKVMARQGPEISALLQIQYRMHEDIMNFSNARFYENHLLADDSVKLKRLWNTVEPDNEPLQFIDTAGTGFEEKFHAETVGLSNPDEASLLLRHLENWVDRSRQPMKWTHHPSIAIISPYREQVELLKREVAKNPTLKGMNRLRVGSVDGFQGQEADVVYISLVRSNDKKEIGFLRDIRRMNVAMTRARMRLVVFGDSATLAPSDFYASFLEFAESRGAYLSAWEFIS